MLEITLAPKNVKGRWDWLVLMQKFDSQSNKTGKGLGILSPLPRPRKIYANSTHVGLWLGITVLSTTLYYNGTQVDFKAEA